MVRPAFVGANSSTHNQSLASRDSARNHCRVSTLPRAWQRVDEEHRAEGPEGVQAVLELLDGYDLPAAAWEPQVLALRVNSYDPHWLDQLCFTGRVGWGRLSPRQNQNGRPASPVRSSPVSVFERENLSHWLELSGTPSTENAPDTQTVLETCCERERYSSANSSRKPVCSLLVLNRRSAN